MWKRVLAAYTTDRYPQHDREQLLARGAAELAHTRSPGGRAATVKDVQRVAREEFGLLLDERQARTALAQRRTGRPR
ncbi:hypothetical protein AR457_00475 [Streptomyces agglomeratus]|uniref:Uncharacterized protein n=1 Tax=Streptomyces agglomeratus TaxID=285458 RepID=A0A1E5PHW3_9ACTN|nr:hypothetical protein AS594_00685 [Streptomyces agglomeratus]OEJ48613.1 hypothetical protein AR457_00475 [Streptomyces agglomeratus]OEJ56185.1 hypothetical protein BGK72_35225 [Streptomyces agglomeratus]OEJ63577.1 hypothetical protein BGM19_36190 [Streptomyces agglomeratus]